MSGYSGYSHRETMECVFPLFRNERKTSYEPDTTKFAFEVDSTSMREETTTNAEGKTSTRKTVTTEKREKKVYLKVYKQSNAEDLEHFFEAFEAMQRELQDVWKEAAKAKGNDATVLFNAMEKILSAEALTGWHDVLSKWDSDTTNSKARTWEAFKKNVSTFIVTKLCPDDAYDTQRKYMSERYMPEGMEVEDYYKRYCTFNRYLPYLLTYEQMRLWNPKADFSNWWETGGFSDQETRSTINNRVPRVWQDQMARTDIGHKLRQTEPIQTLIEHYATLQRLERKGKHMARRNTQGRMTNRMGRRDPTNYQGYHGFESPRRPTYQHYHNYQQQRGIAWPNNPGRMNVYYRGTGTGRAQNYHGGGRGRGGPTFSGRPGPRPMPRPGQQPHWQRPPMQPGRWQQTQRRPNAPEAYFTEDTNQEQTEDAEQTEQEAETFHFDDGEATTEEELISQWNDAFFNEETEDSFFGEDPDEGGDCGWQDWTQNNNHCGDY